VTGNCNLCHTGSGRDNPLTMWSTGDGLGCAGCHGKDYGETTEQNYRGFSTQGKQKNSAWGLRRHHAQNGITVCADCHSDGATSPPTADDGTPWPEDMIVDDPGNGTGPTHYYDRADVNFGGSSVDPCTNEDSGNDADSQGLDNDGDDLYDAADPDCSAGPVCGDGALDAGEDCDDGNTTPGDCCAADCTFESTGSSCGDPGDTACDNPDSCDGAGVCATNFEPVDTSCGDQGVECRVDDACDGAGACTDNGFETNGTACGDSSSDQCDNADSCLAGACEANFEAPGTACEDGLFCNENETCDGSGLCSGGGALDCSDGVSCTDDACNEATDGCDNVPNDANCSDDSLFCNGTEFCDAALDCSSTGDPCPAGEICNESADTCFEPLEIFDDGFESGDTSQWSATAP
jgi:hypothetical protein